MFLHEVISDIDVLGHVEEKCWKAHPELFPKKWAKNDRGRHTVATTISNEAIELGQVEEVHRSLTLMVKPTSGSEKNLISSSLVERLGLETTPHPRPYSLGWIKKDVDTQVNRQCKFRFAITNQFIDEVTCEVVPLDICQVIFGSPYLWERDAVYFRRAQKYELEKDGKKYIVNKSNITKDDDLVKAFQARRMVSAAIKCSTSRR
ncbi:RNA-directed DNA polymerase, eukaryota, reverse transcriptase zinc-binding domain protein [Tanacetum coccineum]